MGVGLSTRYLTERNGIFALGLHSLPLVQLDRKYISKNIVCFPDILELGAPFPLPTLYTDQNVESQLYYI